MIETIQQATRRLGAGAIREVFTLQSRYPLKSRPGEPTVIVMREERTDAPAGLGLLATVNGTDWSPEPNWPGHAEAGQQRGETDEIAHYLPWYSTTSQHHRPVAIKPRSFAGCWTSVMDVLSMREKSS